MTSREINRARPAGSTEDARLNRLARGPGGRALVDAAEFTWHEGARPPVWLSRRLFAGHIYGAARLAKLDAEQRLAIYRWLRSLWWDCGLVVLDGLQGPTGSLLRATQPSLDTVWRQQSLALIRIGLVRGDEIALVERR